MNSSSNACSTRILALPPTVRDGQVTQSILRTMRMECTICSSMQQMVDELQQGAGAVVLTESAFAADGVHALLLLVDQQPPWSEIPFIVLMQSAKESSFSELLRMLRN